MLSMFTLRKEINLIFSTLNVGKKIVCTSDIGMGRVIFGSSESLLSAIVDCLLFGFHRAEEKKEFYGENS